MKTSIWKFKLEFPTPQVIDMPVGAGPISVKVINNVPYLFALVDTEAETESRVFEIYPTGRTIGSEDSKTILQFIDTYTVTKPSDDNTSIATMVGHVFEALQPEESQESFDQEAEAIAELNNLAKYEAWEDFKYSEEYGWATRFFSSHGISEFAADSVLRTVFETAYNANGQ